MENPILPTRIETDPPPPLIFFLHKNTSSVQKKKSGAVLYMILWAETREMETWRRKWSERIMQEEWGVKNTGEKRERGDAREAFSY